VSAISRVAKIKRPLGLTAAVLATLAAAPAAALAGPAPAKGSTGGTTTTPTCNAPALSQAYSWALDTNWYAAVPGVNWDSFSSSGWTLSGGAKIVSTTLADGLKGNVLDLPSGSKAITPQLCISNSYPFGRTEMRNVKGTTGVAITVSYLGANGWGGNVNSGTAKAVSTVWSLPSPFTIPASSFVGWQYAKFTITAQGSSSEYQLSNLYIDPRMH
jgi:hypothetical protein